MRYISLSLPRVRCATLSFGVKRLRRNPWKSYDWHMPTITPNSHPPQSPHSPLPSPHQDVADAVGDHLRGLPFEVRRILHRRADRDLLAPPDQIARASHAIGRSSA